ncbi:MAG: hypothetical protein KDI31_19540, partial [Pseudomonadales bacterium]|nr:hypothetical protein [Pseudomonadales bacterium]
MIPKPSGLVAWILLGSVCFSVTSGASEKLAVLENEALAVTVSLDTGGIVTARRKATGFEHRNPQDPREILNLRLPLDGWDGHTLQGSDAHRVRTLERTADALTLDFNRFRDEEGEWKVSAQVSYALDGEDLVLRLQLRNDSGRPLDRVVFPSLGVMPADDGSETLVLPSGPRPLAGWFSTNTVRTKHDPFERLDPTDFRGWVYTDPAISSKALPYPIGFHQLPTTWMSYRRGDEAVGWDVRDTNFQSQFAVIDRILHRDTESAARNTQTYRLSWHWYPLVEPGAAWESPEVRLKFGNGDWHEIARQHREWFTSWSIKPERPDAFKQSIGWISQGVSHFDQIPEIARSGVEVGAPYFIVYGWYGYGMGRLSYDFHPRPMLGGVDGLRRNIKAAQELGAYPLAWFNGTTSVGSRPEHQQFGKDWIVVDRQGGLNVDGRWSLFDPDRPQTAADALVHFNYDMATPVKDYLLESVRRMVQDYGFPGFEMDQAAKNYLSYRPGSGSGPELGSAEGTREIYERSMEIVRKAAPSGIVVAEGISDFMAQYFDAFWIFEGGGDVFGPGADWVEQTTYTRYSIPDGLVPMRA